MRRLRTMLRGLIPVVIGLLLAGLAVTAAAAPAATSGSRFSGSVEVNTINVDVIVTRHGAPVTDLSKADFEIYEDGVPQPITNFAKVVDGTVHLTTPEGTKTIQDARDVRFRRHIALVFDLNFVEKPWVARVIDSTRKFVIDRSGSDVDWAVILIGSSPRVLLPFTPDIKKVLGALDVIARQPGFRLLQQFDDSLVLDPLGYRYISQQITNRKQAGLSDYYNHISSVSADFKDRLPTLANREWAMKGLEIYGSLARGLVTLFRSYATMPGKKACFLITGNMDLSRRQSPLVNQMPQNSPPILRRGFDTVLATYVDIAHDLWREIERSANTAGFRIYVANAYGLQQPLPFFTAENTGDAGTTTTIDNPRWEDLSRMLADETGGSFFNANMLAPSLRAVDRELKTYYSLAYAAKHGHDNRYHQITVKVRRSGVKVRYRQGLYDLGPETLLMDRMASPPTFPKVGGVLPTTVRITSHKAGDQVRVAANVLTPVKALTFLPRGDEAAADVDVVMAVYDAHGAITSLEREHQTIEIPASVLPKITNQPFSYVMRFELPARPYTVAMAIYDRNAGVYGLAHAQVLIQ